jgi:hypothetical protein
MILWRRKHPDIEARGFREAGEHGPESISYPVWLMSLDVPPAAGI